MPTDFPVGAPVPVVVPVPEGVGASCVAEVRLEGASAPRVVGVQIESADAPGDTPARAWFMWEARADDRGKRMTVRVRAAGEKSKAPVYRTSFDEPQLHVTTPDGAPVLSYWYGDPDPGWKQPLTSFIHPLIGLDGEVLTALSPSDHYHHRGVFWSWVRHERKHEAIGDWWIPRNIHLDAEGIKFADGPVFSRYAARHGWIHQPKGAARGERFVDEYVVCRVFETTSAGRAIDVDLTLRATDEGVRIGGQTAKDKGYGGLTIRFGDALDPIIMCDHGRIEKATVNHLRALWVDWTGVFKGPDGKRLPHRSGGALLVHPSHPDRPPEWITRRYGPINVSYPGLAMLDLPQGKPLHLRYRIWIHRGDAAQGRVGEQYRAYAADFDWKPAAS